MNWSRKKHNILKFNILNPNNGIRILLFFLDFVNIKLLILEQKVLVLSECLVPLSVTIFCAEPRHKRIFTAIGAILQV